LGDVIAQLLERRTLQRQTHLPLRQMDPGTASFDPDGSSGVVYGRPSVWRFNVARLLRLVSFAGLLFAPVTKRWFEVLESEIPGTGFWVAMQRMLADQVLYSVCVLLTLFAWTGAWESGGNWAHVRAKIATNLWPSLRANWTLWPAVQLINQSIVPLQFRMLVAATVNIPWAAYLATKAAAAPTPTVIAKTVASSPAAVATTSVSPRAGRQVCVRQHYRRGRR
jgi:protein Mpv17